MHDDMETDLNINIITESTADRRVSQSAIGTNREVPLMTSIDIYDEQTPNAKVEEEHKLIHPYESDK